jgi:hypothetical protein
MLGWDARRGAAGMRPTGSNVIARVSFTRGMQIQATSAYCYLNGNEAACGCHRDRT